MTYKRFYVLIRTDHGCKYIDVIAIDLEAACADVRAAYGSDVDIIQAGSR